VRIPIFVSPQVETVACLVKDGSVSLLDLLHAELDYSSGLC